MNALTIHEISQAVAGRAAAFRSITDYQPAGGPSDKVFPATYDGGAYAMEKRLVDQEEVQCVLIDSVQSQANRMELALLEEWRAGNITIPVITVPFEDPALPKPFRVTSLEAPHRVADALLRDSMLDDVSFRDSSIGRKFDMVRPQNATALFEICPTALVFGIWDSTGPRGGLGSKFQRTVVSEFVGLHATGGVKTSSRIDPAEILKSAGPVYSTDHGGFTTDKQMAPKNAKAKRPAEINHGNIVPSIDDKTGGFTISKATQTTVVSLPALRRLRFPLHGSVSEAVVDNAARTVLASMALLAATLIREAGADLRSRCLLYPTQDFIWELLDRPGSTPRQFELTAEQATTNYREAVAEAKVVGLPWMDEELMLTPSPHLADLVLQSQLQAMEERDTDNRSE